MTLRSLDLGRALWCSLFAALAVVGPATAAEVLSPEEEAEARARSAPPAIECSRGELSAAVEAGGTATLSMSIRNAGGGTLAWGVSFAPAWVKVVPERGELGYGERRELVIAVDASALPAGVTRGDIVIDAPGSRGGPAKVAVSLDVKPRPGAPPGADAGSVATSGPAAARAGVPLPKRLRYSLGMGVHFSPKIAQAADSSDSVDLAEPFGVLSWQKGAWELLLTFGAQLEGEREYFVSGEFLEKSAWQEPMLLVRKYSTRQARSRGFFELGYGWVRVELQTESMSNGDAPPFYCLGFGARKFYSRGFFDFSLEMLKVSDALPLYESHFSGWSRVWEMNEFAVSFGLALGISF